MIRLVGSSCTPSSGSIRIRVDATLKAAIVSRDGLFPRQVFEAPRRLLDGLKVLELPEVGGRAIDPTAEALCPGSRSSSVFHRWHFLGLASQSVDIAGGWGMAMGSELARSAP
jgi:hypothetical protein